MNNSIKPMLYVNTISVSDEHYYKLVIKNGNSGLKKRLESLRFLTREPK
ncbi:MAG: hypothetical protein ACFCUU_04235 [Cyclobacteriaceae bacterium]